MRPEFVERTIASRRQVLWILWGAFVSSVMVYAVMGVTLKSSGGFGAHRPDPILPPLLMAMGLMSGLATVVTRVLLFTPSRVVPDRDAPEWRPRPGTPDALIPSNPQEVRLARAFQTVFTFTVVSFAGMESVAIFGLVLFFLTGELTHAGAMWLAGLLGFFFVLPPGRDFYQEVTRKIG